MIDAPDPIRKYSGMQPKGAPPHPYTLPPRAIKPRLTLHLPHNTSYPVPLPPIHTPCPVRANMLMLTFAARLCGASRLGSTPAARQAALKWPVSEAWLEARCLVRAACRPSHPSE